MGEPATLAHTPFQVLDGEVREGTLTRRRAVRLEDATGAAFDFFVREPRDSDGPLPAVFLLSGFETGRDSLDLIDERNDLVVLSMNYPYDGPEPVSGLSMIRALPALRRMTQDTLIGGHAALQYLSTRPDVDPERIVVVGVSFGSMFATTLAAYDRRVAAVVLIYGGGDVGEIARRNLRRWWLPSPLVAGLARWVFGAVEPLEHVAAIAPRPLLMFNSLDDEMIPESLAIQLFEAASDPKTVLWYDTGHMDLFDLGVVRMIVADVVRELTDLELLDPVDPDDSDAH